MLGEYMEMYCFYASLFFFPWYLCLDVMWHSVTFAVLLCSWMCPADKQPLFPSYQGTGTGEAWQSRRCVFGRYWLDKAVSLHTSLYCWTGQLTVMDIVYAYLCIDRIKGSVDDVAILLKVWCQRAIRALDWAARAPHKWKTRRKILLVYRMLRELAVCFCTWKTSRAIPFVGMCT